MKQNIYSVSQVNAYIKNMFAQDFMLCSICIKGEVSNCKYHSSGHIYFTVKDEKAAIGAVMFASSRRGLGFLMRNGDQVIVTGSIEVYERDGRYQMYAKEIKKDGEGDLYLRFEALKQELLEMGMFDEQYKKPIPQYIKTLGVVTAPTGAAVQDIRNIARRRNPYVQLILFPAQVQGDSAAESIAEGIRTLDAMGLDVLIVGRGGGSIEDLWAFNEEAVARAIFECETPVISAVGHETDVTIADFVADLRAPTPSAGAELAVYDYLQVAGEIHALRRRMQYAMRQKRDAALQRYRNLHSLLQIRSPQSQFNARRQNAASLAESLEQKMQRQLAQSKYRLGILSGRLDGVSPAKKLSQGYALVTDSAGKRICGVSGIEPEDALNIHLRDGVADVKVTAIKTLKTGNGET